MPPEYEVILATNLSREDPQYIPALEQYLRGFVDIREIKNATDLGQTILVGRYDITQLK